jgi:hypothetical protein
MAGLDRRQGRPDAGLQPVVKDNAATTTPPMELLDTTGHTVADSAAAVRAWALGRLSPAR